MQVFDDLPVRCPGGADLMTDVYLPGGKASARGPVVLVRTPYGKRDRTSLTPHFAERLAAEGFAVVVQDVRGCGGSPGSRIPFVHEVDDGATTLEWIVRQPFSNGRVACWGSSYYGFTAWATAASAHPALKALVTRHTSLRPRAFTHESGIARIGPMSEWLQETWLTPGSRWNPTSLDPSGIHENRGGWLDSQRPLLPARTSTALRRALGQVPTLHSVGTFDMFQRPQLEEWRRIRHRPGQHLVLRARDHMDDPWTASTCSPDQVTEASAREDVIEHLVSSAAPFLRMYLSGSEDQLPRTSIETAGAGQALSPITTPSAGTRRWTATGSVHGNRLVDSTTTRHQSPTRLGWRHDPADPVPYLSPNWWRPLKTVTDYRSWAERDDVLTLTTAPVFGPIDIVGEVGLSLGRCSPHLAMSLVASLSDVDPSGHSRLVLGAAHRLGPGAKHELLHMGSLAYRLQGGHRLRLHLASSCWPFYAHTPEQAPRQINLSAVALTTPWSPITEKTRRA